MCCDNIVDNLCSSVTHRNGSRKNLIKKEVLQGIFIVIIIILVWFFNFSII